MTKKKQGNQDWAEGEVKLSHRLDKVESSVVSIVYQCVMHWAKMVKPLFSDLTPVLDAGCPGKG